jgi:LysR family transcriptional regulator, glycine cleavage system transcriptional activator
MNNTHHASMTTANSLPPIYALRAFESAARSGSFTLAAEELHLTQSAVSKHVKTLEQYFGCKLFVRRGPKMEVTPQGRIFAAGLKRGFRHIEEACAVFQNQRDVLRLKAPSTLTMRWLLDSLSAFRKSKPGFEVQIASVWMDIDTVDFFSEPFDCAILLGAGKFGDDTRCVKLFDEWLIPVCAPALLPKAAKNLARCDLIHPSHDRRDWRRWLKRAGYPKPVDIVRGQVFDSLEQGNAAAMAGHGVSIGDLALCDRLFADGQLVAPVRTAVSTGDAYYLVWPDDAGKESQVQELHAFLHRQLPRIDYPDIDFIAF